MKRIFLLIFCLFGGLNVFAAESANSVDSLWHTASVHYDLGDYPAATADYLQVLDSTTTATSWELLYNLGNCYYKQDDLGRAILYFKRALRLSPTNMDVAHNLALAQARITDRIEPLPEFFVVGWVRGVRDFVGIETWTLLVLLFLALGLVCLVLWQGRKGRNGVNWARLMVLSWATAGVCYLFGSSAYAALHNDSEAVVLNTRTVVRSAPNARSQELFNLHQGTVLEVLERRDNFTRVRIPSGDEGWLQSPDIEKI